MKPTVLYRTHQAARTRRQILRIAMDIASAEGLDGLSIGRLAAEMKMSKTGVFSHFGSKRELQLATIEAAKQVFLERIVEPALTEPRGALRLTAMLYKWIEYVEKIVFRGGCFFAAASAEFDSRPGAVRNQIALHTKAWLVGLEDEIRFAISNGQFRSSVDAAQLAFELHAYVQEANWAFKLFNDKSAFERARRAIAQRIADASENQSAKIPDRREK
jgi:AcrR family transcriptional regulator